MPENTALWLNAKRAPLTVGPAPYTAPRADEIVVRVRAVAVNPMDRLQQTMGDIFTPWTPYPFVVGSDVAGEVVEVGSGRHALSRRRPRGRLCRRLGQERNRAAEGAFQDYVVLLAHMAAPIPDAMSFEDAAGPAARPFDRSLRPVPEGFPGAERAVGGARARRARRCSSGADRPASAAMRSSLRSPPAMTWSRPPRRAISTM